MLPVLRDVLSLGPVGYVLLGAPVVALGFAVIGVAAPGPAGSVASKSALGALVVDIAAAAAAIYGERERFLFAQDHPDSSAIVWPYLHLAMAYIAEEAAVLSSLVCIPVVAIALSLSAARAATDARERAAVWGMGAAVALPAWATAWVLARAVMAYRYASGGCYDPRSRYDAILAVYALLDASRGAVVLAGVVGVASGIASSLVARREASRWARAAWWALGALGVVCYAGSRASAHDAAHPLPFDDAMIWGDETVSLPTASSSCGGFDGPIVAWSPDKVVVDGIAAPDLFETLEAKRELWRQAHPGKKLLGAFGLAASPATRMADLSQVFAEAARAGFDDPVAVVVRPREPIPSRTLGEVQRTVRICATPILPGNEGRWDDHVAR